MATPFKIADSLLRLYEYKMLSFLGINRNIKKEWRTLPRAFGGMGLFNFSVEQTICCLNMLVQPFGMPSKLGKKFRVSLECMQLKVGVNINPLTLPFGTCGPLATYCWFKILGERLCYYGFLVYLFYRPFPSLERGTH